MSEKIRLTQDKVTSKKCYIFPAPSLEFGILKTGRDPTSYSEKCLLCVKHFHRPSTYKVLFIHYKINNVEKNLCFFLKTSVFKMAELGLRSGKFVTQI